MTRLRICISYSLLVGLLVAGNCVNGQTTVNGWLATFNTFKVNKKFSVHLDVQARSTDQLDHLSTFLFRPGVNWHFRKNMIASAGYALVHNRRILGGVSGYASEHRIWQQLIINHNLSFIPVQHRFRVEQRFLPNIRVENGEIERTGNSFANRFRYFTRSIIPLNGSKPFTRGAFASLQNEVFLNIGDKSNVNGKFFDQNRFYVSIGYRASAKFDLEAGYLNQYVAGSNESYSRAHIIQLATYLRL